MKKWYSLIDKVYGKKNLEQAFKSVKANKGAPGVDGMTVEAFAANLDDELNRLHHELRTDEYKPKPDGSKRPLGIPTVKDRVVQQALLNILQPIFEPDFHPSSYGYRPGRSCQQAVAKAERFMNKYALKYVVDMDLSKCFDRLDHELIIEGVNRKVSDGKVLNLIRKFLKAGVMKEGNCEDTEIGSPQGGVISPLLTNIYLDRFDQKTKSLGIRIVRYADDILVFAKNHGEAKRNQRIAFEILEKELKLVVNQEKTHLTSVDEGVTYLGFVIYPEFVSIHPKKIAKFKDKIREMTPRNHGKSLQQMILDLNPILRGWANYFRIANCENTFRSLMGWIRRRLRMKKMKEWKSWKAFHKQLRRVGFRGKAQRISMTRWRNSASPLINIALPNKLFNVMGLINLEQYEVGILRRYWM